MREAVAEFGADFIKWMFISSITQVVAIVGVLTAILFAFFKP